MSQEQHFSILSVRLEDADRFKRQMGMLKCGAWCITLGLLVFYLWFAKCVFFNTWRAQTIFC